MKIAPSSKDVLMKLMKGFLLLEGMKMWDLLAVSLAVNLEQLDTEALSFI